MNDAGRSEHREHGGQEDSPSEFGGVLFDGDPGELPYEVRRVLAKLLSGPSIEEKTHTELWPVLCRAEMVVRKRLGDLFLELIFDKERGIAFTRQIQKEDMEIPILLRRASLTFIDSALILYLREKLVQADSHAERAVVSEEEIRDHLGLFEQALNNDKAGFAKRIVASIKKMKENNILRNLDRDGERWEISPALRIMFTGEAIAELTRSYRNLVDSGATATFENDEEEEGDFAFEETDT